MRKQLLLSFLCGVALPLVLMGMVGKVSPDAGESESDGLSGLAQSSWDSETRILVLFDSGNVRQMTMGEYLCGVVLAEMPADFEEEALKAQAVVARTYTCKRMEHNKHGTAALCTNSGCCQGYRDSDDYVNSGGSVQSVEKICSAVTETDGQVLVYGGELIDATYFSCSGGQTEDAVAVWGQDVPYLRSVESPGEEDAPRYIDRIRYTPENFKLLTGISGEGSVGSWFGPVTYTDGGGVDTITICGRTFTGKELRGILGLRSTMFTVSVSDGMIVLETKGFGHRVGMSQYGAQAMAEEGSSYQEILEHYYVGALLKEQEKG